MTIAASDSEAPDPVLAGPHPLTRNLSLFQFLRTVRDNAIATFSTEAFERDIIESQVLGLRIFLLNDPAGIKHVLLDNVANYGKTELMRRILEPGLGKGLITSEGETWRRHRRIMAPSFDHRSIQAYSPIMTETAEDLLGRWAVLPAGAVIDVAAAMMAATLTIISRTMFSSDSDGVAGIVERGVGRYQAEMRPNLLDFLGAPNWLAGFHRPGIARRTLGALDAAIDRLITERGRSGEGGARDLLGRLIAARDAETGGGMTAQEIRDQVVTIFLAGHETTAVALTWTWYLLSQHPAEEARLHAELDAVLGGRAPRHEDLARLPYTRMVIEESMRLYPPVPNQERAALADDVICGRRVPRGAMIAIIPWVLHRHRRLWDRPDRFDPERFAPERAAARPRFAYLPFSGGPRICIGAAFAMAEAMLLLATIA
jgi:cytochrome P450